MRPVLFGREWNSLDHNSTILPSITWGKIGSLNNSFIDWSGLWFCLSVCLTLWSSLLSAWYHHNSSSFITQGLAITTDWSVEYSGAKDHFIHSFMSLDRLAALRIVSGFLCSAVKHCWHTDPTKTHTHTPYWKMLVSVGQRRFIMFTNKNATSQQPPISVSWPWPDAKSVLLVFGGRVPVCRQPLRQIL